MFVRIEQSALVDGLNIVSRAVGASQHQPILRCILFEVVEDGVRLTSSNLEMCIETAVIPANPSMDLTKGVVAFDAKMFTDIIKSLPPGEVVISVDDTLKANIKGVKGKFNIAGYDTTEFPSKAEDMPAGSFSIDSAVFQNLVRQTIFCVSHDPNKMPLTGVLFNVSGKSIEVCALDMFRVACNKSDTDYEGEDFKVLVPGKTLSEVTKLLPTKTSCDVVISFDKRKIWFNFDGTMVMSRLIDDAFMDYSPLFNNKYKAHVTLNRQGFIDALTRAKRIGTETKPVAVRLEIDGPTLMLSSENTSGTMNEDIAVEHEGDAISINLNPNYLLDALNALTADRVVVNLTAPQKPITIGAEGSVECPYLIVPLRQPRKVTDSTETPEKPAAEAQDEPVAETPVKSAAA